MPNQKRMKLSVELSCKREHENWFQSYFFGMWLLCLLQMVLRLCVTICGTEPLSDILHVFSTVVLWFVFWGLRIIDCRDIWISSAPSYSKISHKVCFCLLWISENYDLNSLRGCSVGVTDERDLWYTPSRWPQWHDIAFTWQLIQAVKE
jgi:hypothetical protein